MSYKPTGRGGKRPGAGRPKKEIEQFQVNTVSQSFPHLANLTPMVVKFWEDIMNDPRMDMKYRMRASQWIGLRTLPVELYIDALRQAQEMDDDAPQFFSIRNHPGNDSI